MFYFHISYVGTVTSRQIPCWTPRMKGKGVWPGPREVDQITWAYISETATTGWNSGVSQPPHSLLYKFQKKTDVNFMFDFPPPITGRNSPYSACELLHYDPVVIVTDQLLYCTRLVNHFLQSGLLDASSQRLMGTCCVLTQFHLVGCFPPINHCRTVGIPRWHRTCRGRRLQNVFKITGLCSKVDHFLWINR